jgi:hypothetical protein
MKPTILFTPKTSKFLSAVLSFQSVQQPNTPRTPDRVASVRGGISLALLCLLALIPLQASVAFGAPVNLAAHKTAIQSSTYQNNPTYAAGKGTDGQKYDTFLFHTAEEQSPWWEVDLGAEYAIENVILYNRVECCQDRVRGLQVLLSSDGENYKLVYTHDNYAFRDRRVDIGGLRARFVRVQLTYRGYLHLQEVEVYQYGTWLPSTSPVKWTPVHIARQTPLPSPTPQPSPTPPTNIGSWRSVGTGDCPGRDVANTSGPNPDPAKCNAGFAGFTAVCWDNVCTYKNVATGSCTGGASPGRMYTCGTTSSTSPPSPTPQSPQVDIGLNGCWSNCMVHIYQDRDGTLYFSSAWKNPLNCTDCDIKGWKLNRGKGQITGQDVHLYEIVAPTLLKDIYGNYVTGQPLAAEYFLKLSTDGNRLDGYWTSKGQRGGNVNWTRDK